MFVMWLQAMMLICVFSNNVFWLDSYGHVSVIYNILSHDTPSFVWHIETYVDIWSTSFYFFQAETNKADLSYVYSSLSLINQFFVICSFAVLYRLLQLCFMQVPLDLGDSCMWMIANLHRLMHWEVSFQSLYMGDVHRFWIFIFFNPYGSICYPEVVKEFFIILFLNLAVKEPIIGTQALVHVNFSSWVFLTSSNIFWVIICFRRW